MSVIWGMGTKMRNVLKGEMLLAHSSFARFHFLVLFLLLSLLWSNAAAAVAGPNATGTLACPLFGYRLIQRE